MTYEQFTYWLKGYLFDKQELDREEVDLILVKIEETETKQPIYINWPYTIASTEYNVEQSGPCFGQVDPNYYSNNLATYTSQSDGDSGK